MPPRIGRSSAPNLRMLGASARPKRLSTPLSLITTTISAISSPIQSVRTYAKAVGQAIGNLKLPDDYVPPTQPPSARAPGARRTQLLRTYTSLLRSTPLILFFQHNNLTSEEWVYVRRELTLALQAVPQGLNDEFDYSQLTRLSVVRTSMFRAAMKLLEVYDGNPTAYTAEAAKKGDQWVHDLSHSAMMALKERDVPPDGIFAQLEPLISGPIAILTVPVVSPAHVATALSILAPSKEFPAPTRRKRAGFYDFPVQSGLAKLLLLGGRIEGKVMDGQGIRWVAGINGGLDAMRAQIVHMLQAAGMNLMKTIQAPGSNLWLTLETQRSILEEKADGNEGKEEGKKE